MARKTKQTKITSAEKMTQVNKNNLQLKVEFILYLKSVKRSPGTITGYSSDINIFFTFILDELGNKDFSKITKRDLIRFQNWMVSQEMSSARIRRIKAAISSLSNFVENIVADDDPNLNGYRSIVRKIENPPLTPVREKTVWTDAELMHLLDVLIEHEKYEMACLAALAMYGGRRKAELCRFKVSDFGEDHVVCNGALYKSDPILTKGGKYLECFTLKKKFDPYLQHWLEYRASHKIESQWLFPAPRNPDEHIQTNTIDGWARTFSRITGKDFYAHSLRHFFVSALIKAGIPDGVVVEIMGWASSEMLRVYDDNPKDERIAMFFKDGDIDTSQKRSINEI